MDIETLTELYWEQQKSGNPESPESFAARYPGQQTELLAVLPALAALETMTPAAPPLLPPNRLGDFQLHEPIGSGGMGNVYRATQLSLQRDVAVKILSSPLAMDEKARQRFMNEARIIAGLHHPNIVNVYGAGYEQGWCFYVMELIDGQALNCDAFSHDPEKLQKITGIAHQAADALAYAHQAHILHRDFKLANLLMDHQGNVHLSDFGISSILQECTAVQVTRSQEGTLRYMAPEIFLNGTYSFASDQYGFGVSMYELITGKPCFSGLPPAKIIHEICEHRFPELPEAGSDLAIVINKCTSFNINDRYPSMAEVRDELSRILHHEPIHGRPVPYWRKIVLWGKRRPAIAALLAVCGGLFLAFLAAVFIGYWKTAEGLKREIIQRTQAERNARVANETLEKIFDRASGSDFYSARNLTTSPAMLALLRDLTPYYEEMQAQQPQTSMVSMEDLRFRLGKIAMQAGEYELARKMFALALPDDSENSARKAECLNRKALAALFANRLAEARTLWKQLADTYENSPDLKCRLIAADAIRHLTNPYRRSPLSHSRAPLTDADETSYLIRANDILKECSRIAPDDPEIRFLSAWFSATFPDWQERFTPGENPFVIISKIADRYPQDWKYQKEFIDLVLDAPFRRGGNPDEAAHVATAISFAERLLVMMPFNEELIADTLALYRRKSFRKRGGRNRFEAYREQWHLIGFLKPIAIHPQTSDASRELILDFLLAQLQTASARDRSGDLDILLREIQDILSFYHGDRKNSFQEKLNQMQ